MIKNATLVLFALGLLSNTIWAQQSDWQLLKQHRGTIIVDDYQAQFGFNKEANAWQRYNPVALSMATAMFFYQRVVSPQIFAGCLLGL